MKPSNCEFQVVRLKITPDVVASELKSDHPSRSRPREDVEHRAASYVGTTFAGGLPTHYFGFVLETTKNSWDPSTGLSEIHSHKVL